MSPPMIRLSYNDIHKAIQATAPKIKEEFAPNLFIAIGGGGFIPARILRSFCKTTQDGQKRNIPIQAIGLTLYESLGGVSVPDETLAQASERGTRFWFSVEPSPRTRSRSSATDTSRIEEVAGTEVVRVQWIDFSTLGSKLTGPGGLLGRRILIIDEVDDTRTTLVYTVRELQKDIEKQLAEVADVEERERLRTETKLGIFVVHNKLKPKAGEIPSDVSYFSAVDTPDVWLAYPWECEDDIDEHDALRSENVQP
ncbi:hypoxanthine-guanine phosphoribosyltransferase [Apiotrichum porosum]|uniref:Hypoxanthine-guanine phosphoribosyltransferase n=1 Tax=Apiotrichum porosum TaxID=105984 RepID=A0A427Y995_9TREE|nr:hypoxanthine-guanine phosphoribosyltransferase [Apiotrichum porosum]RSH87678.1 hypoxanthine-guanine phosphoribosyltransferase [Apiotrichum porosum]